MRRKERAITDKQTIESILKEAHICRIAMCDEDLPYIVPMNFGYKDACIYLHSAKEGRKIDILKRNPHICFEVESKVEIKTGEKACNWGMKYISVIGSGKVIFVYEEQEKLEALNILMEKYAGTTAFEYREESLSKVQILKIKIEEMTGKKAGY